jgi:hypothetical protein
MYLYRLQIKWDYKKKFFSILTININRVMLITELQCVFWKVVQRWSCDRSLSILEHKGVRGHFTEPAYLINLLGVSQL